MTRGEKTKNGYILVMILYLAGIFMGAIDTGIVTPARTIIQNELGVEPQSGIWMITIYTLAYAASVPIMGKLADKFGRKYIYLICILFFGLGSLLCGLSGTVGGFPFLIIARVIQAIGGGGIVPIATAEFGTTFPPEKRGMALGLVGGVYGLANVFGASAGSAILDIFGVHNWEFIFYINIPISLFIIICGCLVLKNNRDKENSKRIDIFGILALTIMVLSLLYGLKNLDFFDLANSIITLDVYPFLLTFIIFIPIFIFAEKRAEDPVICLKYFTDRNILVTLVLSTISGFLMMGVIFVPQFSENCLKLPTGSGGYLVIILGLFAGVGAPVSGKLIDKYGPKIILAFGFICSGIGALFMMLITTEYPSMLTVLVGLALAGLGMGFTMGTPVNYMMLTNTDTKQSNSALATLSLVRSIGTAIAPAIMVGFIANAGMNVQGNLMSLLPKEINMPSLPYAEEIDAKMESLKDDPQMSIEMEDMPSLSSMETIEINMGDGGDYKIPAETLEMLQSSDVTTITVNTKVMAETMFNQMSPNLIEKIQGGINKGINGISSGISEMNTAIDEMKKGYEGIGLGIEGMQSGVSQQKQALAQLQNMAAMMSKMPAPKSMSLVDMIPEGVKTSIPKSVLEELATVKSLDDLNEKIKELEDAITSLETELEQNKVKQGELKSSMDEMSVSITDMETLTSHMAVLRDAIPDAFDTALKNYLEQIDEQGDKIEEAFQVTLNKGFSDIYLLTVIVAVIAMALLVFYNSNKKFVNES